MVLYSAGGVLPWCRASPVTCPQCYAWRCNGQYKKRGVLISMENTENKIITLDQILVVRQRLRQAGRTLVLANGCFDILHVGHVNYLAFARRQGDALLVGLNSDASVKRSKGPKRPINNERERALLLAALATVDYVVIFDGDSPAPLVEKILPDVLVKGKDWAYCASGREVVERHGGRVVRAPIMQNRSTTNTITFILAAQKTERV